MFAERPRTKRNLNRLNHESNRVRFSFFNSLLALPSPTSINPCPGGEVSFRGHLGVVHLGLYFFQQSSEPLHNSMTCRRVPITSRRVALEPCRVPIDTINDQYDDDDERQHFDAHPTQLLTQEISRPCLSYVWIDGPHPATTEAAAHCAGSSRGLWQRGGVVQRAWLIGESGRAGWLRARY
jgi:hypothetical protein